MLLFLLIVAVIAVAVFAHMTLYVAGAIIGLLVFLVVYFIKRRKKP